MAGGNEREKILHQSILFFTASLEWVLFALNTIHTSTHPHAHRARGCPGDGDADGDHIMH